MLQARPVVVTVLLGLLLTMTQAPAVADHGFSAPQAPARPPMAGELFSLTGNVPVDPAQPDQPRQVDLQRYEGGQWRTVRSRESGTGGAYSIPERISVATWFRVAVGASGDLDAAESHTVKVLVAPQWVVASVERVCNSAHDCWGNKAKAIGQISPVRENRRVTLQYKSGSSWKSTSVQAYTDANGRFETPAFSIAGWSQWRVSPLRIVAGSYSGSTSAASVPILFMPGPTQLGDNVLRVDVNGGSFPQTKGVDYTGYATLIRGGVKEINRARLDKFGVRGSTTSKYPKKPYNLRFQDAPTTASVFGMPTDRSWTLLAMYADQSYVRDKTALDLGRKLSGMTWNPDSEYVELFVNSQYMGAYLMTEKVQIDGDKVNVGKDTGMIMETDMDTVSDPRKGFRTARGGLVFAFKDPDGYGGSDGITSQKLGGIWKKLGAVESLLYTTNRKYYYKQIDRNSAADFYLAVEFFKDIDADFWRSKYFSWDMANGACGNELCDGLLHFGPLWDFDKSVGNVDATNPGTAYTRSYRGWAANGTGVGKANRVTYYTHWFAQLWKVSAFRYYLSARWNDPAVKKAFWETYAKDASNNQKLIGWGAKNDRARWAGYAKLYQSKGDEVGYVKYWLANRFKWIDSQL